MKQNSLTIGSREIWLGQPVVDIGDCASLFEATGAEYLNISLLSGAARYDGAKRARKPKNQAHHEARDHGKLPNMTKSHSSIVKQGVSGSVQVIRMVKFAVLALPYCMITISVKFTLSTMGGSFFGDCDHSFLLPRSLPLWKTGELTEVNGT